MESYIFHNCGIFLPNLFIYPVKILSTETYNFPYFPLNNICALKKNSPFLFSNYWQNKQGYSGHFTVLCLRHQKVQSKNNIAIQITSNQWDRNL